MTLRLPSEMVGSKVHAWIFFAALDGKSASKTAYLVQLPPLSNCPINPGSSYEMLPD
jgi:hypothetical protein